MASPPSKNLLAVAAEALLAKRLAPSPGKKTQKKKKKKKRKLDDEAAAPAEKKAKTEPLMDAGLAAAEAAEAAEAKKAARKLKKQLKKEKKKQSKAEEPAAAPAAAKGPPALMPEPIDGPPEKARKVAAAEPKAAAASNPLLEVAEVMADVAASADQKTEAAAAEGVGDLFVVDKVGSSKGEAAAKAAPAANRAERKKQRKLAHAARQQLNGEEEPAPAASPRQLGFRFTGTGAQQIRMDMGII